MYSPISKENYQIRTQGKAARSFSFIQQNAILGTIIGEIAGALIGTAMGTLTANLTGILFGFTAGIILGALSGMLTGIVVGKIAGANGGTSVGAYAGMLFGALQGALIGIFIPETLRADLHALQVSGLSALTLSRFETVSVFAFLLCVLGAFIGVWVAGKNYESK